MDLKQLEYIVTIADEGNIAKAAEKLYLTQSALNQQLLKLESELGVALFERRRRQMVPTAAGRLYLDTARSMIDMKRETYRRIHDIADGTTGEITIVFTPERGVQMFSSVFSLFHSVYPNIHLIPHEARNRKMQQMLLNQEVTLACMSFYNEANNPNFSYYAKANEAYLLALPESHPLAARANKNSGINPSEIDLNLLKDEAFVLRTYDTLSRRIEYDMFSRAGFKPNILFETSSSAAALAITEKQIAPCFTQQFYADKTEHSVFFKCRPFPVWTICVATLKNAYLTDAERWLIKLIDAYNNGRPLSEVPLPDNIKDTDQ